MAEVGAVDSGQARDALREEVARVTALLRSVRTPDAPALGEWTLAEVAMHLSQAFMYVPGLADGIVAPGGAAVPARDGGGGSFIDDVWDLGAVTVDAVNGDDERDLSVIADRIDTRAVEFLERAARCADGDRCGWMVAGTTVALPVLTCHLLSETIVHGGDIARADGQRWPVEPARAAMVVDGFLIPVLQALGPRAMVDQEAAAGLRATYDVRVRGGGRHHFVFDDGALTITDPSLRRVDCHISADPVAMLAAAWGRRSQWPAIATAKLVAWGRRPWLGPRFAGLMRTP